VGVIKDYFSLLLTGITRLGKPCVGFVLQ